MSAHLFHRLWLQPRSDHTQMQRAWICSNWTSVKKRKTRKCTAQHVDCHSLKLQSIGHIFLSNGDKGNVKDSEALAHQSCSQLKGYSSKLGTWFVRCSKLYLHHIDRIQKYCFDLHCHIHPTRRQTENDVQRLKFWSRKRKADKPEICKGVEGGANLPQIKRDYPPPTTSQMSRWEHWIQMSK